MFGAQEQNPTTGARGEGVHQLLLGIDPTDVEDVVGHIRHRRVLAVHRMRHLVTQEAVDQLVDAVVQRGGEQQSLPAGRGGGEDARDTGQEAQVGHMVGLVDDGDLDGIEAHHLLAHQVLEPAGAGDDDVGPGLQCPLLT